MRDLSTPFQSLEMTKGVVEMTEKQRETKRLLLRMRFIVNNKIQNLLKTLNLYTINKMSIASDNKHVELELIDDAANKHTVEFSNINTYCFLDDDILEDLNANHMLTESINFFEGDQSKIVAVDQFSDGGFETRTLSSPNIILNTEAASIMMETKSVTVNGVRYPLSRMLN